MSCLPHIWKVLSKPVLKTSLLQVLLHSLTSQDSGSTMESCPVLLHLSLNLLNPQKRPHYLNLRRNMQRLEFIYEKSPLTMVWKSTLRRDLPFSRLKVMQGTYLELWTAIRWCIWKTKGGDRKRARSGQVPSDISLDCVWVRMCISWCIFITIL